MESHSADLNARSPLFKKKESLTQPFLYVVRGAAGAPILQQGVDLEKQDKAVFNHHEEILGGIYVERLLCVRSTDLG